jgi:precorrin-8X/cobalt-precorrin-8 methylmutase
MMMPGMMARAGGDGIVTWTTEAAGGGDRGEEEAYRIIRSRIELSHLPKHSRDVTERVIYASADLDYASDLVYDEEELMMAVAALANGAPVIADATVVAAGITDCPVICKIDEPLTTRLARTAGIPAAAAAVRLAFGEAGPGAVWVVGCAATALTEILTRGVEPAFVIGMPAGLAGAAETKAALRASGIPAVSNVSAKGGAVVAAAAFEALLRSAAGAPGSRVGRTAVRPPVSGTRPPGTGPTVSWVQ